MVTLNGMALLFFRQCVKNFSGVNDFNRDRLTHSRSSFKHVKLTALEAQHRNYGLLSL